MTGEPLFNQFCDRARIDAGTAAETAGEINALLVAAVRDVLSAAGMEAPDDLAELPDDLRFAITDHATRLFDLRGADKGTAGLSLAASRIAARYRGIRADAPEGAQGGDDG